MKCPSCGAFDVEHKQLLCLVCRGVVQPNPEHIKPIVKRVMDDLFDQQGEAA